jgi:hypothetical protein
MVLLGRGGRELGECLVGLPGLEPGTSSLSEMDGQALCYPAFPQLALIHEWHRDGVNHSSALFAGAGWSGQVVARSGRLTDRKRHTSTQPTVGAPDLSGYCGAPATRRGSAVDVRCRL